MLNFYSDEANGLYLQVLRYLASLSPDDHVSPRGMPVREVADARAVLGESRRPLASLPERRLNYHFAVAEWWWIATGRDDVASIEPYCSEIRKFSDDGRRFFGAYGPPWRTQARYVVDKLKADPDSRQAVLSIWRPSPPLTRDVPCTVSMQYLLRGGRLHAVVTMRSWDAWLGFPYDLHNFARLQACVAGELGAEPGWLSVHAGSLHMYERNYDQAVALLAASRAPGRAPELPTLPGIVPPAIALADMAAPTGRTEFLEGEGAWRDAVDVMRHRHDPAVALPEPWCSLLAARP